MFRPNFSLQNCIRTVLLFAPCTSFASPDNLTSYQSFTGLGFTPNAQVIDTGDFHISFSQGVPYLGSIAQLDDWFIGAGILPGVEAGGRIVTQTYDCNVTSTIAVFETYQHLLKLKCPMFMTGPASN